MYLEMGQQTRPRRMPTKWLHDGKISNVRNAKLPAGQTRRSTACRKRLPALLRAYQIQARASRVGFDWTHDAKGFDQVLGKIEEEIQELRVAIRAPASNQTGPDAGAATARQAQIVAEFGDVVFSLVNLARFINVNPEDALRQAANRFVERFQFIEAQAAASGRTIGDALVCRNGSTVGRSQETESCHKHRGTPS